MNTVALEFVPPNCADGAAKAVEDAQKVIEHSTACGLEGRIGHVMIPGMIAEDGDRPVEMKPKLDPLEVWRAVRDELPGVKGLCTQVTAFLDEQALTQRFTELREAGIEGIVFVGVPRGMPDGSGEGVSPIDALGRFQKLVPNRGVILIPTRDGEQGRFNFKCDAGATFGMTQLLYSDAIVGFLQEFARTTPHRPEVLLSFGFVPKLEQRLGLIQWLIQDPGNLAVEREQRFVAELADASFERKKQRLVELYRRVIDGVGELGFPLSIHLEAPYGFVKPAFETFAEMLDYWSPAEQAGGATSNAG